MRTLNLKQSGWALIESVAALTVGLPIFVAAAALAHSVYTQGLLDSALDSALHDAAVRPFQISKTVGGGYGVELKSEAIRLAVNQQLLEVQQEVIKQVPSAVSGDYRVDVCALVFQINPQSGAAGPIADSICQSAGTLGDFTPHQLDQLAIQRSKVSQPSELAIPLIFSVSDRHSGFANLGLIFAVKSELKIFPDSFNEAIFGVVDSKVASRQLKVPYFEVSL